MPRRRVIPALDQRCRTRVVTGADQTPQALSQRTSFATAKLPCGYAPVDAGLASALSEGLRHPGPKGAQLITSSARASIAGGIVRPRAFAVLMLMTSSNFVGRSTGRSAGLAPLRILSTKTAA